MELGIQSWVLLEIVSRSILSQLLSINKREKKKKKKKKKKKGIEELEIYIGDEALAVSKTYDMFYPVRHGPLAP